MVREGTAELLRRVADFEIVAEASDGQRAVELAQELKPDVVVMDVRMPVLSGLEATRRISAELPATRVLVLSAYDDDHFVFSLLQAGASGYLLKTAPIDELVRAIYQVHAGDFPLHPTVVRKIVLSLPGQQVNYRPPSEHPLAGDETAEREELSEREQQVLQLLAEGMANREIAQKLFLSERTVQAHLTRIFAKLGVTSRLEAVLAAVRSGWLTLGR